VKNPNQNHVFFNVHYTNTTFTPKAYQFTWKIFTIFWCYWWNK